MDAHDEADLVVLDALEAGPLTADRLRQMCDFDVTGILDGWDELARGLGGEARAERLLAALSVDQAGGAGFAKRLERLVERGWVARDATLYALTSAGEARRRAGN